MVQSSLQQNSWGDYSYGLGVDILQTNIHIELSQVRFLCVTYGGGAKH